MSKRAYDITEHGPSPITGTVYIEGYTVGQWCPTPDGSGPSTAVVIQLHVGDGMHIGWRLKSRRAVNVLIEVLERHRDEVFPV